MESIDNFQIVLSTQDLTLLNLCLSFLMFGVALDISVEDFKAVVRQPVTAAVGLASQWLVLPALTFVLVLILEPHPGIALGMMLVAACPGGNTSNFLVHLSQGNRALSVSLTAITTTAAFIYTPASLLFWGNLYEPSAVILKQFSLSILELLWILTKLILIPLVLGMSARHFFPQITGKYKKIIRWTSIVIYMGIIVGALVANMSNMGKYLGLVFWLVLLHNALAFTGGWLISKLTRRNAKDTRTIMMETGIQNSGLGLIIIFNFYDGMPGMLLVAAWWGIWHMVSGSALASWWSVFPLKRSPQDALKEDGLN